MSFARREFEKMERESRGDRTARDNTKRLQQELDRAYARIEELEEELATLRAMEHYAGDRR